MNHADKLNAKDKKEKKEKPKLEALKITGDNATANVMIKDDRGRERKGLVKFVKIKDSWRYVHSYGSEDEPNQDKDKDKNRDRDKRDKRDK